MRSLALLLLLGCAKVPAPTVPVDVAPVPRLVEDARIPLTVTEARTAFSPHAEDTSWVASLPKAKTFARIEGLARAESLAITWRQYPQHRRPGFEGEADYPSLFAGKVELVLRGDSVVRVVPLGQASGNVEGGSISACERRGYRHTGTTFAYAHTELRNRVAYWEIGTMQGGTEYLLLLGADRIHVLHRETHDGACPTTVTQGPFTEVCEDMTWERAFEIPVQGEPRITEEAVEVDESGRAPTPIDCTRSYSGEDLVTP